MRKCTIPPSRCTHQYAAPCCRDCKEKGCEFRCENDPAQCRCWTEGPPSKKRGERRINTSRVVQLYRQGLTQAEVAQQLGCCKNTVGMILREAGVKRNG